MSTKFIARLLQLRLEREKTSANLLAKARTRLRKAQEQETIARSRLDDVKKSQRLKADQIYEKTHKQTLSGYALQARMAQISSLQTPVGEAEKSLTSAKQEVVKASLEIAIKTREHKRHAQQKDKWNQLNEKAEAKETKLRTIRQEHEEEEVACEWRNGSAIGLSDGASKALGRVA